jgi:hypothetical protein
MALHNPPLYRYALFEDWDKEAFAYLKKVGESKDFPQILGSTEDKNKFVIALIRTQKSLHGWRALLVDLLEQIKLNNAIDTVVINQKYPSESVELGRLEWATYKGDQIVSDFLDELMTRPITFLGSNQEMIEFVLLFWLGQLGADWEQTIMMIWELLGDAKELSLKELNHELKGFDYLRLFNR